MLQLAQHSANSHLEKFQDIYSYPKDRSREYSDKYERQRESDNFHLAYSGITSGTQTSKLCMNQCELGT